MCMEPVLNQSACLHEPAHTHASPCTRPPHKQLACVADGFMAAWTLKVHAAMKHLLRPSHHQPSAATESP
jgi:hypothetical protein